MSESREAWRFCGLVLIFSAPFWLLGAFMTGPAPLLPIALPVSALMTFAPAGAALLLTWREGGVTAVQALLRRVVRPAPWSRPVWLLAAIALLPLVLLVEWLWRTLAGAPLPEPRIPLGAAMAFLPMFLIGAIGEELGWQGYLYPRLARRMSALAASLTIAAFWSAWHIIPFIQAGRDADWIVWQCLVMVPLRILTVWLYAAGGRSVALAVIFHAFGNVAQFMYPNYGSHYDPRATFVALTIVVIGVLLIAGPRRLGGRTRR